MDERLDQWQKFLKEATEAAQKDGERAKEKATVGGEGEAMPLMVRII